ncbi:MAG: peptidylprolyl isomerase [Nitrospiraceae bacterium]|nr:peptidylprolyl isomerase [Nitrospiraceae bacterium]
MRLDKKAIPGFFAALFLVSCAIAAAGSKPLANVNGTELVQADFNEALNEVIPAASFHGGVSPETLAKYRSQVIEKMIDKELLYQEARKEGLKVPRGWVKEEKKKTIARLGGEKIFRIALKQNGLTEDQYDRQLERQYLSQELVKEQVDNKAAVTNAEAMEYYEKDKKYYFRPESVNMKEIFLSVDPSSPSDKGKKKKLALELLEKLNKGGDFGDIAWKYSEDKYRVMSGDFGVVHKGMLDPDLEKAVFAMKAGETKLLESIYGYHIVRVESKNPPTQMPFKDVVERIKRELAEKRHEELMAALVKKAREGAKIEILEKK